MTTTDRDASKRQETRENLRVGKERGASVLPSICIAGFAFPFCFTAVNDNLGDATARVSAASDIKNELNRARFGYQK